MATGSGISAVDADFDIVVVGGGITGLCLTWFLADEGAAVLCLDDGRGKGSIANAGSLHVQMQSRLMRLYPERLPDYEATLSLYPRAVDVWAEVVGRLDEDVGFRTHGGLMIAETREQMDVLADKHERERRSGVETSVIGRQELLRIAPYLTSDATGAVFCEREGKIDPLLANDAIRRMCIRAGGVLRRGARVDRIERRAAGYAVVCDSKVYHAGKVVIAAGSGSGGVAATLGVALPAEAEPLHMNVTDRAELFMKHLLQHAERPITMKQLQTGQVIIGGGWPAQHDAGSGVPTVMSDSLLGNLGIARQIVPGIRELPLIRTWAGVNPIVDLLSVLGEAPGLPGLFVAIPGDAGYTLGPCCARLVCEAMSGRDPDYPLDRFSPARFDVALPA